MPFKLGQSGNPKGRTKGSLATDFSYRRSNSGSFGILHSVLYRAQAAHCNDNASACSRTF
jgi:hypothetical protein